MLGHGRLDVVVDRARLHHADQVVRVDLEDLVHPGQIEDDGADDCVGPAGQPGARAARHDRGAKLGTGAHDVLHLGLGPGAHPGDGFSGRRPFGLVVRDRGEHVRVDHEAVTGQLPAQRLDQGGGGDHDSASGSESWLFTSTASRPPGSPTHVTSPGPCPDAIGRP